MHRWIAIMNARVTQNTNSWYLTANFIERLSVRACSVRSPLVGCQVTSRTHNQILRYLKCLYMFWTYHICVCRNIIIYYEYIIYLWKTENKSDSMKMHRYEKHKVVRGWFYLLNYLPMLNALFSRPSSGHASY